MKRTYTFIITTILTFTSQSDTVHAQNFPNYANYGAGIDTTKEKPPKTPPANFFPGGKSSTNFFENKSVTPELASPDRQITYGTDRFPYPISAPAPIAIAKEEDSPSQEPTNSGEESWSTSQDEETDEVKNLKQNIEQASEQSSDDPRIQDVLAQSKKIKEALFGKASSQKSNDSKSTVVSKGPGKVTKEIERF